MKKGKIKNWKKQNYRLDKNIDADVSGCKGATSYELCVKTGTKNIINIKKNWMNG